MCTASPYRNVFFKSSDDRALKTLGAESMGWDEGGVQKWGVVGPEVALMEKNKNWSNPAFWCILGKKMCS